jgi:hypothetical protein
MTSSLSLSTVMWCFSTHTVVIPLKLVVFKSRIFSARYLRRFTMKDGRLSDAQIMAVLKQAEGGTPVSELGQEHGMSSASFLQMAGQVWRHGCVLDC